MRPARYDDAELQDLLAAEFVLGSLRGAARRRMQSLLRQDPVLLARVGRWEERMFGLALRAPGVKAPSRVWRAVRSRIRPRRPSLGAGWLGWWDRLGGRQIAFASLAGIGALAALVAALVLPASAPQHRMVAVLNDQRAQASILLSWTPEEATRRRIQVRILTHPEMPPGTSWQAWLIVPNDAAPIALGFVTGAERQQLEIPAAAVAPLSGPAAIGVSLEAQGGSASGLPSGPYLFQGPVLRLDG